jgi:hypothetical protein
MDVVTMEIPFAISEVVPYVASVAGVITSGGIIAAFIKKPFKLMNDALNTIKALDSRIDSIENHLKDRVVDDALNKEASMLSLKQAVYSSHLPDAERIRAGELYKKHGGNGYTGTYIDVVLRPAMEDKVKNKAKELQHVS